MKQIKVNVYTFEELDEQAKWEVVAWLNTYENLDEEFASLEAFKELLHIECDIKHDGTYWHTTPHVINEHYAVNDLAGGRLFAWLMNHVYNKLYLKRKQYGKRCSRIAWTDNECPLTGLYMDCDLIAPITEFLQHPSADVTFTDLMGQCLDKFCETLQAQDDYHNSFEYAENTCEANEWFFYEDGRRAA